MQKHQVNAVIFLGKVLKLGGVKPVDQNDRLTQKVVFNKIEPAAQLIGFLGKPDIGEGVDVRIKGLEEFMPAQYFMLSSILLLKHFEYS